MSIGPFTKDLTGKVFGRLTVMGLSHHKHHAYWRCVCECGNKRVVRGSRLTSRSPQAVRQCVDCAKWEGAHRGGMARRKSPGVSAFNRVADTYRRNASKKGLVFDLSESEMRSLFESACFYCGIPPASGGGGVGGGVGGGGGGVGGAGGAGGGIFACRSVS